MEEGEKEEDSEDDDVTSSDDEEEGQSTENGSIESDDDEHDEWNESEKVFITLTSKGSDHSNNVLEEHSSS